MKIKNYSILLAFTISYAVNAQEVVTTAGNSMANTNTQVNWTIGEPVTETVSGSKAIVTSGFNQPVLKIVTTVEDIKEKIALTVFPNPTSQYINIKFDGQLPVKANILSLTGKVIYSLEINEKESKLDFSGNLSGVYLIEITDKFGKKNTYRIVKH